MPAAPDRGRRAALAALGAAALAACGAEVPPPGARPPPGPRVVRRLDPVDLLPADLDLVVRVDVARMRAGLGPAAAEGLTKRALEQMPDDAVRGAIERADVVWIALRLSDLDAGDRVVVFEGRMRGLERELDAWQKVPTEMKGIQVFDRRGGAPRAGAARIVAVGDRALAFVTPVELSSVTRVLRDGPDERRGDPAAKGLVSLDLRAQRLPPRVERRFPSIGKIIAGLERVRATADLVDDGVRLDAEILGATPGGAARALRFLEALRDNVEDPRYVLLMKALSLELVERTVRIRWTLPAAVVLGLLSGGDAG